MKWVPAQREVLIGAPGENVLLTLPEVPAGATRDASGARRLGNVLYVPLVALRPLGLVMRFDPATRTLNLSRQEPAPREASLSAILADPPGWVGRFVRLHGEYLGWSPYPYCFATASGEDVAVGDFVLRNEGGALYCHPVPPPLPGHAALGAATSERPPLTPYETLGRRIAVVGTVRLAANGTPRLDVQTVASETGLAGVTCCLRVDRTEYRPGERMSCSVTVFNPGREALAVPVGLRGADLSLASPDGSICVSRISLVPLTLTKGDLSLVPNAVYTVRQAWPIPDDAVPGAYQAVVHLGEGLESYPASFRVALPGSGPEGLRP